MVAAQCHLFSDFHKIRKQNLAACLRQVLFLNLASIFHSSAHCAMKEASPPKPPGIFANGEYRLSNNACKADNHTLLPMGADLLYDVRF